MSWWAKILVVVSVVLIRGFANIYFRLKVEGLKGFPRKGPLLVACNHVSHLDPPLIGVTIPRYNFMMAKKELYKTKFLEWFMQTVGTILVDRSKGKQALEEAIRRLGTGDCITVFPEGTRSEDGRLMQGKVGIVLMAIRTGCPILPAAITGSEKAMTKGSKGFKSVPIRVIYGKPYQISYDGDPHNIPRETLARERCRVMQAIEDLLPEHMHMDPEKKQKWYGKLPNSDPTINEGESQVGQTNLENPAGPSPP